MKLNKSKSLKWYRWIIIVLVAVIAVLLYIGTFGTVDVTSDKKKLAKPKQTNQEIFKKHEKLLETLIQKRQRIYKSRKRVYKSVYFIIRFLIIGVWIAGNLLLYYKLGVNELGTIIDYNNAFLIIIIALVFLFWGVLSSLKDWLHLFETRLELWIFQKYLNLPEKIEDNKSSLARLKQNNLD